jgi:hypothetical protein
MTTAVISFAAGFLAAFALCLIAMPIQRKEAIRPKVKIVRRQVFGSGYAIRLPDGYLIGNFATVGDASRVCTRNGFEVVEVER